MQQNINDTISLNDIARSAHLSVSFFQENLNKKQGAPQSRILTPVHTARCQLLHFSNLSVNEVASEIGISAPLYFSRLFKQQMDISPVVYRKGKGVLNN